MGLMTEDRRHPLSARERTGVCAPERKTCFIRFPESEGLCTVTSYWGLTIEKALWIQPARTNEKNQTCRTPGKSVVSARGCGIECCLT